MPRQERGPSSRSQICLFCEEIHCIRTGSNRLNRNDTQAALLHETSGRDFSPHYKAPPVPVDTPVARPSCCIHPSRSRAPCSTPRAKTCSVPHTPAYTFAMHAMPQTVFEAVRRGFLKPVTRRLNEIERAMFIQSGAIFVWEESEDELGLKRWTDGRVWSQSRMREVRFLRDVLGSYVSLTHSPSQAVPILR